MNTIHFIMWFAAIIMLISFVCKVTRPRKTPVKVTYTPRYIEADGTIVCMKVIDTKV